MQLALGKHGFPVSVLSLAMRRGDLPAAIVILMSDCLWSGWKWWEGVFNGLPFPTRLWKVDAVKKNPDRKKIYVINDENI